MPFTTDEDRRKLLCDHLGKTLLAEAPRVLHSKCTSLHTVCPPPFTPTLPDGSLWTLINHLKVIHQYTELISSAASGEGPHTTPLSACQEGCVNGLEWFAPLLCRVDIDPLDILNKSQRQVDCWRQANPGLFSHAEAAFHVHQAFENRDMACLLVHCMDKEAKQYEVDISSNMLHTHPTFQEFQDGFTNWRGNALYHLLCLSAKNMPMASDWMPRSLLHESDEWQDLLTQFNTSSFCTTHRMEEIFTLLWDRSDAMNNQICSVLDRVCILARVNSTDSRDLDECLAALRFPKSEFSPFSQNKIWFGLKRAMEGLPPSLLCPYCPSLHPPNRSTWGYQGLRLLLRDDKPYIHTGGLSWINKKTDRYLDGEYRRQPDRLRDILLRIGEAATAPEVGYLMLDPKSFSRTLQGLGGGSNLSRSYILGEMDNQPKYTSTEFAECVGHIMQFLPVTSVLHLPSPQQLLAWRVDCPPRAILYRGDATNVDLEAVPPHRLHKTIHQDKVINRTVSGISLLSSPILDKEEIHEAIKACIAEEVAGPHSNFSDHPFHKVLIRGPNNHLSTISTLTTTTTLAEAVAVFAGSSPVHLSDVALHESEPWNEEHVDGRYAERQTAENGSRLRDWVTVYFDGQDLQRCRLASHEIRTDKLFQTHLPLVGKASQSWVSVSSTLPLDTVMLREQPAKTPLESLKRAVDTRFLNDPKLLPVRHVGDKVDRENMEIYSDELAGQVVIAYAPKSQWGHLGVEFLSFAVQ